MNKAIAIIDMPQTCGECLFCSSITEMYVGNGFYKKFGKCVLAKDIEDPWRNVHWQSEHKEDWCPLKPVPEKKEGYESIKWQWGEYEDGWNHCIDVILGD